MPELDSTSKTCSADQLFCMISNSHPLSRLAIETLVRDEQGRAILDSLTERPLEESIKVIDVIVSGAGKG